MGCVSRANAKIAPSTLPDNGCINSAFKPSSQDLVKQVLSALRAIAGNDDVKDAIVNAGGAQLTVLAMNRHMSCPQV